MASKTKKAPITNEELDSVLADITNELNEGVIDSNDEPNLEELNTTNEDHIPFNEIVEEYNLSLRKIALNLDVNYNMLLKKSKEPIIGQPYDPNAINWDSVESYLIRKLTAAKFNAIDWSTISETPSNANSTLPQDFVVNTKLTLRQDRNFHYTIAILTPTHIILMPSEGTQPRLFSIPTFLHQGPKIITIE